MVTEALSRGGSTEADNGTTHRTARNAVALGAAEIIGKVSTLAYTVVAARLLSQGAFGAFAFGLAIARLVAPVPTWGFETLLVRRASAHRRSLASLTGRVLGLKFVIGSTAFGAVGLFVAPGRPTREAVVVLGMLLAAAFLDTLTDTVRASAAAVQRQVGVAVALIADRAITAVLAVTALVIGWGVVGLAGGFLFGSSVGLVAAVVAARRSGASLRVRQIRVDRPALELIRSSTVIGISAIVATLHFRLDIVIIEWFLGDRAVASYAVAYRLVETVLFLSWSLTRAVFPVMSAHASDDRRVQRGIRHTLAVLAFVYVPFTVVSAVAAPAIIGLLFGERYVPEASNALPWLAPAPLLFGIGFTLAYGLYARDRDRAVLAANVMATIVNIALNVALIPVLGIVGAAVTTSITLAMRAGSLAIAMRRDLGERVGVTRAHAEAVPAAVVLLLLLWTMRLHVVTELLVGGAAYLAAWWLLTRRFAPQYLAVIRGVLGGDVLKRRSRT